MSIENPYRNRAYFFTIAVLIKMGLNKSHKFDTFVAKLRHVWSATDAEGGKNLRIENRETKRRRKT